MAGRSNVGKSSLLNHLFNSKNLVKTSSTPGKTQALNFFSIEKKLVFVDLPGYGYAQVPESVRKQWGPMVQTYLEKREQLKLILFLFDIRRLPTAEDRQFLDWVAESEKSAILVITKVDKVSPGQRISHTKKIIEAFGTGNLHFVLYSVTKNVGLRELTGMIQDALNSEAAGEEMENEEEGAEDPEDTEGVEGEEEDLEGEEDEEEE